MDAKRKNTLKAVTLELRHLLEGRYDSDGKWKPGDLEQRLAAIGVRRDRASVPVDELRHLGEEGRQARRVVDAYLKLREQAGVERSDAVAEFVRETAYTWANRLLALRCMEARELIDSVILQQEAYGGRSLEHHRLAQRHPELCAGDDDGHFAVLDKVFREQAERLPMLFDPQAPGIALRPAPSALKDCFGLLSLNTSTMSKYRIRFKEDEAADDGTESPNPFTAPDALGWAYQYWNTEEKNRVFEKVRTVKGAKIAGADIVPATQLYTEDYMVKFLVHNSLGATWMGMHPESKLAENWEYYVKDADRVPAVEKPVREITFLDPACGSGHFLLEAFDLLYAMYEEEAELIKPEEICDAILTKNLFGIDIDARAVQIAEATLWMKAAERAFDYKGAATNLVAATGSHLKGRAWDEFLEAFQHEPSVARVLRKFAQTMEHIDEIGSLARPAEDLREIIRQEHATWERQIRERKEANFLFPEIRAEALSGQLPFQEISDDDFGDRLFYRARAGIDAFTERARQSGEFEDQLLGNETRTGFRLVDLLSRSYDVVSANPPYMGSKNMGPTLKTYVERNYKPGKRDLYAAFILRCLSIVAPNGTVAMVTMNKWIHSRAYSTLRCGRELSATGDEKGVRTPHNLIINNSLRILVDLGSKAFDPENHFHDGVQVALFIVNHSGPSDTSRVCVIDVTKTSSPEGKNRAIIRSVELSGRYWRNLAGFSQLPGAPLCYGLSDALLKTLTNASRFGSIARVRQGICTTADPRFVRMFWETTQSGRWHIFAKGGGHRRWDGLRHFVVDWQYDGRRIKEYITDTPHAIHWSGRMPEADYFFRGGWCFSRIAFGSLGIRCFRATDLFGHTNPIMLFSGQVGPEQALANASLLNSPVVTFILRNLTQSNDFHEGYLRRMPFVTPDHSTATLAAKVGSIALEAGSTVAAMELTEATYSPEVWTRKCLRARISDQLLRKLRVELVVCVAERLIQWLSYKQWRLSSDDVVQVEQIMRNSNLPVISTGLPSELPSGLVECWRASLDESSEFHCQALDEQMPDAQSLAIAVKTIVNGESESTNDSENDADEVTTEDDEADEEAASSPMPCYGQVDECAKQGGVDVITAHRSLVNYIEKCGVQGKRAQRLLADEMVVFVLRLFGYRWPKEIENGQPVPEWADSDGIIPLSPLTSETTLFDRVLQRLSAAEIDATVFSDVMGKPLDAWLTTELFKYHTKQFKKRPITWQLQSGKFTARSKPVFACLLYYHKLDADTIPKLHTHYVGPLRQRLETELRGIEGITAEVRSDRQEKRRIELDDAIRELTDFEARLEQVSREGFAATGLAKLLADEPLDRFYSLDGKRPHPTTRADLIAQESAYAPDINDGVRVNIAPLQKAGLLAADVLAKKDLDKAIADRAQWRADERRWVREGKLPQPGWWPEEVGS